MDEATKAARVRAVKEAFRREFDAMIDDLERLVSDEPEAAARLRSRLEAGREEILARVVCRLEGQPAG